MEKVRFVFAYLFSVKIDFFSQNYLKHFLTGGQIDRKKEIQIDIQIDRKIARNKVIQKERYKNYCLLCIRFFVYERAKNKKECLDDQSLNSTNRKTGRINPTILLVRKFTLQGDFFSFIPHMYNDVNS